jgi:hypothetical protein
MAYDSFLFPMATFKEIEPTLKKCFNIDRNTPTIAKCISESFTANELINTKIPETYLLEDDHYDIFAYTMDYAESIRIPLSEAFDLEEFQIFCQSYNIEGDTLLFDTLAFMFLFNDTSNKKYHTGWDEVEQDFLQYALGVRPELLKLYIALEENKNIEPITIRVGSSKSIVVDNDIPWLREELERYLNKYLGVTNLKEAKREYLMNYTSKEGAPNNWKLNRYIWGIYNLLEETGTIKAKTERTVSRKQAKFIEDYLFAIGLINLDSKIDEHNIRSRLNSLMKNYDSIEELTENLDYKSSPNNEDGTRLY